MKTTKILITGERRSGTTLVANFLNAQEGFTIYRDFLHVERLQKSLGGAALETRLGLMQRLRLIDTFDDWTSMLGITLELNPEEFSSLLEFYTYVLEVISHPDDIVVGHKTTMMHHLLGNLLKLIPELKVVFLLRDPRDLVTSALKRFADEQATLFDYIEGWQQSYHTLQRLLCDEFTAPRVYVLRYEDFILETGRFIPQLSTFLGGVRIEIPEAMNDYGTQWQSNSAFGYLKQTFDPAPIGRWRSHNPDAGRIAEVLLSKSMQECGYEISAPITDSERTQIRFAFEEHQLNKMGLTGIALNGRNQPMPTSPV